MRSVVMSVMISSLVVLSAGCAALNPRPPVEEFADKLASEALVPAIREGMSQGIDQLMMQAGAQVINPTYRLDFSAKWVTGVEGSASVGVVGLAGQLQVTSAAASSQPATSSAAPPVSAPSSPSSPPDQSPIAVTPAPPSRDTLTVTITSEDTDSRRGFTRMESGALVVIEDGAGRIGETVTIEVTSRVDRLIVGRIVEAS